jgi:hypothetical protein
VIPNSIFIPLQTDSLVGPVGPVVPSRIWCEQAILTGEKGGTSVRRAARADRRSFMLVPPVPPISPTKSLQNCLQYHRSTRYHGCRPDSKMKNAFVPTERCEMLGAP